MFKPKGYIAIAADKTTEDKLMEIALDAGAEDIQSSAEVFEVYTTPQAYERVLKAIKAPASSRTTPRSASTRTPASISRARRPSRC
jgi:transcriptional/translational regulatory protein YebC/TACO1